MDDKPQAVRQGHSSSAEAQQLSLQAQDAQASRAKAPQIANDEDYSTNDTTQNKTKDAETAKSSRISNTDASVNTSGAKSIEKVFGAPDGAVSESSERERALELRQSPANVHNTLNSGQADVRPSPTYKSPEITQFANMRVDQTSGDRVAPVQKIEVPSLTDLPSRSKSLSGNEFHADRSALPSIKDTAEHLPNLELSSSSQVKPQVQNPFFMTDVSKIAPVPPAQDIPLHAQNATSEIQNPPRVGAPPAQPVHDSFYPPPTPKDGAPSPQTVQPTLSQVDGASLKASQGAQFNISKPTEHVPNIAESQARPQLSGGIVKNDYQIPVVQPRPMPEHVNLPGKDNAHLQSQASNPERVHNSNYSVINRSAEHEASRDLSCRKESISDVRGGSDLVKSHRSESFSTDKFDASGKTVKPSDGSKIPTDTHTDASARTKREPLIIPGVITSRITDKVKNEPVTAKGDKSDESAPGKKVPGSTSEIISGVAGKIADSLSTIKDKFIPGQKTQPESTQINGATTPRPDLINHAEQPKSRDFIVPTPIDKNQSNRGPVSEFVVNGKLPVTKAINGNESETLVDKAGGLKQALQHIFGEHPTLAADLKFVTFPGPKTLPVETKNIQNTIKVVETKTESDKHSADMAIKTFADAEYLRNQKGDKIQTLSLKEQLAQLKAMEHLDSHARTDDQPAPIDSATQIKQFTTQLGDITRDKEPVDLPEHTVNLNPQFAKSEEDTDSRYLYLVKTGDTLRSIFIEQLPHLAANVALFEFFVQINEQTVRLHSDISSDGMSLVLRAGTTIKLPTPKQISSLSAT